MTDQTTAPVFIHGYKLERKHSVSYEYYNVYAEDIRVATIIVQHGKCYTDIIAGKGKRIHTKSTSGFNAMNTSERLNVLRNAVRAIQEHCLNSVW